MRFAIDGVANVSVDLRSLPMQAFLADYLAPFFPPMENCGDEWVVSCEMYSCKEAGAAQVEGGVSHDGGRWSAWHRDSSADEWTVEELDENRKTLLVRIPDSSPVAPLILARSIRSLLVSLACSSGWCQVHASAFEFDGRAALVLGNKGAGKTSILLTSLIAGADFISNDRVLLGVDGSGLTVRGLPHSVTVRTGTGAATVMRDWPSSYDDRQPSSGTQTRYLVRDVLAATGRTVCTKSPLGLVVLPHVDISGTVAVASLDRTAAVSALTDSLRGSVSSFDPLWDAWRPHSAAALAWRDPKGLRIGYDPSQIALVIESIRRELQP